MPWSPSNCSGCKRRKKWIKDKAMAFGYPGIRTRTGQGAEGRVGEFPNVAQAAGIITLVAVAILILMHRGFAGISVDIN